jgi:hypothetical protein
MKAYTDYPFSELGDEPYKEAPIRECVVIRFDGDKYCDIEIEGKKLSVKYGYLYNSPGRCGEVKHIDLACYV